MESYENEENVAGPEVSPSMSSRFEDAVVVDGD